MILALLSVASAELPPPDYAVTLTERAGAEIARAGRETDAAAAETFASRWIGTFGESARVTYELGLVWRLAGNDAHALTYLDQALALDPDLAAARYDRGEVRLAAGDLSGARDDFEAVSRLEPEAWPGWFRLADLAGRAGEPKAFEAHMLRALRCGFQVRSVAADPTWRGFLQHPRVGPVLTRLITVYQGADVFDALQGPLTPQGE